MFLLSRPKVSLFILTLFALNGAASPQLTGYTVFKTFRLDPTGDEVSGEVQLLLDSKGNNRNPRNGILRIVATSGDILSTKTLHKPQASLELIYSKPGGRSLFLLTENMSIQFGSYNGPITNVVAIKRGTLLTLTAKDKAGRKDKITLMQSLKTAWKTVPGIEKEAPDILKVSCRPNFGSEGDTFNFKTTYSRFSYEKGEWSVYQHETDGFCELGDEFPSLDVFPRVNR